MNSMVVARLCEIVGKVICHPKVPIEDGGGFMRMQIFIDIFQPLCRGRVIYLEDDKEQWVSFKYEQLPNLCYWCGRLTHNNHDYELWLDSAGTLKETEKQYGPWIQTPPFAGSRKAVITVPGFYMKNKGIPKEDKSDGLPRRPSVTDLPTRAQGAFQTN